MLRALPVAAALVILATPAAGAEELPRPWLDDERLSEPVRDVEVEGSEYRAAMEAWHRTEARIETAAAQIAEAEAELATLGEARDRILDALVLAERRSDKSSAVLASIEPALSELVVAEYMRADPTDVGVSLDAGASREGRRLLARTATAEKLRSVGEHRQVVDSLAGTITDRTAELAETDERIAATEAALAAAVEEREAALVQIVSDGERVADARLTADVVDLEMSLVALDAYVSAAEEMAAEDPGCGLHWSLLAAIGRTESRHGTHGGASVEPDGNLTRPIIGIPLDGGEGLALIPDSDGGALDGDPVFDRAVGPMQFIPSTWTRWQRDGTGDGNADPQNYYDAALTAAAYVCAAGPVSDEAGARRAALSYNASGEYADLVLSRAAGYASFALPGL